MNGMFYRGEIYYVLPEGCEIGSEQHSGRPGIIVSNDQNNKYSSTLEVVYLTTKEKKPLPTHIHIETARLPSTAICEQVFTVDKLRMNDYVGKLTKNEMSEIETGMLISLGLDSYLAAAKEKERATTTVPADPEAPAEKTDIAVGGDSSGHDDREYIMVCAQRDVYKELCMNLIDRK